MDGTTGATNLFYFGINETSGAVGYAVVEGDLKALYWNAGVVTPLPAWSGNTGFAADLNNYGRSVGASSDLILGERAATWNGGMIEEVSPLLANGSVAFGINDSGAIVGRDVGRGFVYEGGTLRRLANDIFVTSEARDINESGTVVGYGRHNGGTDRAFIEIGSTLFDIGTVGGGDRSYATKINELGQVMCWSSLPNGDTVPFVWQSGEVIVLPTLGPSQSFGYDINDSGQVVGASGHTPVLWQGGVAYDLRNYIDPVSGAGWGFGDAHAINNLGQIVGMGTHDGEVANYLLTPVPEPTTIAVLGIGLLAAVKKRRPKKE